MKMQLNSVYGQDKTSEMAFSPKIAVILCGGLSKRLKSFTAAIPRPLLPIGEQAILEIQIEHLAKDGFEEIVLATNEKSSYLERFLGDGAQYGVKLWLSKESQPLGTAGPLSLLREELSSGPFLLLSGDVLTLMNFANLFDYAVAQESSMTAAVRRVVTPFAFGDIHFEGDYVTSIEEKPDIITHALAGVYVLKPEVLDFIPDGMQLGIEDLICKLISQDKPVSSYMVEDYWLDIGEADDLGEIQEEYLKRASSVG